MPTKERRLAVPVSDELSKFIEVYKGEYSHMKLSDTAVLKQLISYGAKVWYQNTIGEKK